MLIPEECFFDGTFYTTCFIRKVVKFQFWRDCVPDKCGSVSKFLGWETSYQHGWLSFRNFVLFMQCSSFFLQMRVDCSLRNPSYNTEWASTV